MNNFKPFTIPVFIGKMFNKIPGKYREDGSCSFYFSKGKLSAISKIPGDYPFKWATAGSLWELFKYQIERV